MKKLALATAVLLAAATAHAGGIENPKIQSDVVRENTGRAVIPGSRMLLPLILLTLVASATTG